MAESGLSMREVDELSPDAFTAWTTWLEVRRIRRVREMAEAFAAVMGRR